MFQQTDGKVVFLTGNDVARTTAPAPAVTTTTIITTGTGKKAKATGVTITFNTGINPGLASNVKVYLVRPMKNKKAIKLKKKRHHLRCHQADLDLQLRLEDGDRQGLPGRHHPGWDRRAPMARSSAT